MVLPELSKGEVCALRHLKSTSEQVLGKELLEIRNHLLVHGLQDRGGVGWKVENLQQISVNSSCLSWRNVCCLLIILMPLASVIAFIDMQIIASVTVSQASCFSVNPPSAASPYFHGEMSAVY